MRQWLDHQAGGVLMRHHCSTMRNMPGARGFTLIEFVTTIAVMCALMLLAIPSMSTWIASSKIRTVADSLQTGLRMAQTEAVRRNRQIVFSLTNDSSPQLTASLKAVDNGSNWSINVVPSSLIDPAGAGPAFVEAGVLTNVASGVQIEGPGAICFNGAGRLDANSDPGTGASCSVQKMPVYKVTLPNSADARPLSVFVSLGGQVRMCDPAKTMSQTHPDGCPSAAL